MADEQYFTKMVDGQLSVATVAQDGEIIPEEDRPGDKYTTAMVQTDDGPQLCVKTYDLNSGGGGGGGTVDQTYDPTSTNAQSGTAVAEAVAELPTPLSGASAPTSGTNATAAGQTYVNTSNGSLYVCKALTGGSVSTNYTNVGGVTIDSNYVASNFGNDRYLTTNFTFKPNGPWKVRIRFKTGDEWHPSYWYKFLSSATDHYAGLSLGLSPYDSSTRKRPLKLELSYTGETWDLEAKGTTDIGSFCDTVVEVGWTGTQYYMDLISMDDDLHNHWGYNREATIDSTTPIEGKGPVIIGRAPLSYSGNYSRSNIYLDELKYYVNDSIVYEAVSQGGPLWLPSTETDLKTATGYDGTKTQVLKNVNGTLTWVDE